ncbi:CvpA family protein [Tuanshanicoccus lijuaniae]|uniref:CvpA family protein n=1 Tax=Aerococcaceae bacterium zg-1292 TaxID=2774330 RepID=UPI001BD80666|nr:CvpA family protein [Aerococcaceae bacterium zg-BR9]MBF6978744.1 CvpA family protein [Aerococcaceae bacterium zg-BR22]MBS4456875.1 CvpA family protein [Aerococcaceae bacterium zg-A91]MBS4458763.1 CvpA family protein [Aerococcaceae bacterium zg-BR33]
MLSIIILIVLAYSFYTGFRRGLIMQLVQLIGYLITFLLATKFYEPLSKYVEMLVPFPSIQQSTQLVFYNEAQSFLVDQAFYRAVTFVIIWLVGWLVTKFLAIFFTRITYYNMMRHLNHIGGGVVNLMITFLVIYVFLFILSLIPVEFIQQQFVDNPLAYRIVANTPIISDWAAEAWLKVNPFS